DRADDVLGREPEDRGRALVRVEAERRRDVALDRSLRGLEVELHRAAEEEGRIDVPEREAGVGHRWPIAAPPVARRSRNGARALGPDVEETAFVDPGDAASARSDALHVDGREARHVAHV